MYEALEGLEPKRVFELFSQICQIPHGSKNEGALSDYVRDFCLGLGLPTYQDAAHNLIVKKPATPGYENAPTCVLQAHLDMVCEKNASSNHDFLKDPIRVLRDGDRIHADGTTLGADDGTGVAFAMAVLESNTLKHPAIEVVLTADEEAGMTGIMNLDFSRIDGRVIINLDCSDEGIVVGCAGTVTVQLRQLMERAPLPDSRCLRMEIRGFKGGHSGLDITKERGNANQIAARVLAELQKEAPVRLLSIQGGLQSNAITRENTLAFAVPAESAAGIRERFEKIAAAVCKEHKISDPEARLELLDAECPAFAFTPESTDKLISLLLLVPSGILHMNMEVPSLPEISGNIGIVNSDDRSVSLTLLYRTCYNSRKQEVLDMCGRVARLLETEMTVRNDTPEWEYKADSRLSALIQRVYQAEYGKPIVIEVSHGGNECGTFYRRFPDADIVCTGTRIVAPHSPDESVAVSVVQKEWNMLCKTLEGMLTY